MIQSLINIFTKMPELRQKIFYTLMMIGIYRIGVHIPTPFVNGEKVSEFFDSSSNALFGVVNMFTGGGFEQMSVMAIGIMPYISAQIIIQMLMIVVPALEKLKKEGDAGQKKIEQITRYGAIGLAFVQSIATVAFMIMNDFVVPGLADNSFGILPGWLIFAVVGVLALTTGTALLMWIGEQITANGVGQGISLIIAMGILATYPSAAYIFYVELTTDTIPKIYFPMIIGMGIVTTVLIVLIQEGARKIPIQHARRTVGRKVQQAQTNYLPLKVNTAGVIPVIFSSAILTALTTVFSWAGAGGGSANFIGTLGSWFTPTTPHNLYVWLGLERGSIFNLLKMVNLYVLIDVIAVVFFCFFYTAVTFNPSDVADNLKKAGAFVPGYRPGKQTADYIDMVLTRVTTTGALFLVVVAIIPLALNVSFNMNFLYAQFAGGTGLIIIVGVVLDTMKRVEAQLIMHNYEGFRMRRQSQDASKGGRKKWSGRKNPASS